MTIQLSVLTVFLSICILACTASNKVIAVKKYPKGILGKWYIIKITTSYKNNTGELAMPPTPNPYIEYLKEGKFDIDFGEKKSGNYTLTDKNIVMTQEKDIMDCDITHLSKNHMNITIHDYNIRQLNLFMSKFPSSNEKSILKK